jgi:cytosine/creatinine deaminase
MSPPVRSTEDSFDLVIANARLRGRPGTHFIGIAGGRIAAIGTGKPAGGELIDAEDNLVTESFVDAHLHLCKVYTLDMVGEDALSQYTSAGMTGAASAISIAARVKDDYAEDWIYENARRAVLAGISNGVTHLQAFADTDTRARLEAVKALLRVREDFRGVLKMRVVAFPQDGVVRDPGAADFVRAAVSMGADVVGGIPWIEDSSEHAQEHIDAMLDIAQEFDRPVAMLVDDSGDASLRTTEQLASTALERGFIDRVTCCHARALSAYPDDLFLRLVEVLRRAQISFVTDPHTGSLCTRAMELDGLGLPVALGQDDIADAYYPFGQHNMLEVAFLAAHILGENTTGSMDRLFDMITTRAADVLRFRSHRLEEGARANVVVLDGSDLREVFTRHRPPLFVITGGRLIGSNRFESVLNENALTGKATPNQTHGG